MKQIFIIASLLFAVFSHQAVAQEATGVYQAELKTFSIGHSLLPKIISGKVEMSETEITLTLQEAWSCPDGLECAAVMPAPYKIKLPVTRVFEDWCGTTTYIAEVDNTPVDGLAEIIEVNDYSAVTCRIAMPYPTKVQYRTFNPWLSEWTYSTFDAGPLVFSPDFI